MDLRDAIAIPATLAFVAGGVALIAHDIRVRHRRRRADSGITIPSRWQRLPPRVRVLRRITGVIAGIGAAALLQVVIHQVL